MRDACEVLVAQVRERLAKDTLAEVTEIKIRPFSTEEAAREEGFGSPLFHIDVKLEAYFTV